MDAEIRRRLKWVQMYAECRDAGFVCRRCCVSRPTLRKWVGRYEQQGIEGLRSLSRKPLTSPNAKLSERDKAAILKLRSDGFGARRIQKELRLYQEISFSLSTIHRVLTAAGTPLLVRPRRRSAVIRYSRPIRGDRVQMDTMKVSAGVYQYTAIDDCSRFRVLGVYRRRDAASTLKFLERVIKEMPFAIQRIQTDRGLEFFAQSVQERLAQECIKFRPIAPRSPYLNGKVERSQLTDRVEFWSRHRPKDAYIAERIEEWQFDYNWRRPHGALHGRTPADYMASLAVHGPLREEIVQAYDRSKERLRFSALRLDQAMAAVQSMQLRDKIKSPIQPHSEQELSTAACVASDARTPPWITQAKSETMSANLTAYANATFSK